MSQSAAPRTDPSPLRLGFVPLTDAAPLIAAVEKGFFADAGLEVELHREVSWASLRDKLAVGLYDAAHLLYPMPLAMTLGLGAPAVPTQTSHVLSHGGNAITLRCDLAEALQQQVGDAAARLAAVLRARGADRPPLRFGVPFPASCHHYELRRWLASGGIDAVADSGLWPGADRPAVRLRVMPPSQMAEALRGGDLDGMCVGEPWNSLASYRGWGSVVAACAAVRPDAPEKVLGVTAAWAAAEPARHTALRHALAAAGAWCDDPANHGEVARLLGSERYLDLPPTVIQPSLGGAVAGDADATLDSALRLSGGIHAPRISDAADLLRDMQIAHPMEVPEGNPAKTILRATYMTPPLEAGLRH